MGRATSEIAGETAEAVARRSYGKLIAFLAARSRDVAAAEDALSDAFASALAEWPKHGVPEKPEAWLITVARRKLIDRDRQRRRSDGMTGHLQLIAEELEAMTHEKPEIPDERLSLMFACAHPAIDPDIRAPLILQTILGFDAAAVASAFLISPAAMGQRLARAKRKIRQAGIPLRIPGRSELHDRLDAVCEAIYAAFAEGWADPAGTDIRRSNLADEGIWLGRLVVELLPDEAEALGLLSLMLHCEARRPARRSPTGDYVPLGEQDTDLWDRALIEEAERVLTRANAIGVVGRYQLEAAIQSAHAVRRLTGVPDWAAIARLYDALAVLTGSPVVAINRAIIIAELNGPADGLAILDDMAGDTRLDDYQPFWAARAGLLAKLGHLDAAENAYARAVGLEADPAVRRFLQERRARLRTSLALH